MRRVLICSGVLGGGTALVFALAALTATAFPHGANVPSTMWGSGWSRFEDTEMAIPMPAIEDDAVFVEEGEGKP